jgi:hypothetical protein
MKPPLSHPNFTLYFHASAFGAGNGGQIAIDVAGGLTIDGAGSDRVLTGIAASTNPGSTGNAGLVTVRAGRITIVGFGGAISVATFGQGAGGDISVTARSLRLADHAVGPDRQRPSSLTGHVDRHFAAVSRAAGVAADRPELGEPQAPRRDGKVAGVAGAPRLGARINPGRKLRIGTGAVDRQPAGDVDRDPAAITGAKGEGGDLAVGL